jgi:hypothetical protein
MLQIRRVPVFGEGFACIFVVCLSAILTMQMNGVGSVVLQVSEGVSNQQRDSWNGELPIQSLHTPCLCFFFLGCLVSVKV